MADEAPRYEPVDAPVMIESEFDMETIEHIGELLVQVVLDDPMFQEKYGHRIGASWHPAKIADEMAQRLIYRSMAERL